MKKRFAAIIMASIVLSVCLVGSLPALAENFVIDDYQVDVNITDDRSYYVEEIIETYFTDESRGIFRCIPNYSSLEKYEIEDINVIGDPFQVENDGNQTNIRIGDPDIYFDGPKTYNITYTLKHWADADPNADWVYLDVIGTQWATTVQNAEIDITLPTSDILSYTINVGQYGTEDNGESVQYTQNGNKVTLNTTKPLDEYEGITLMLKLPEGTFANAKVKVNPYIVNNYDMVIDVDDERNAWVTETIDMTFNEETSSIYYLWPFRNNQEKLVVKNFSYDGIGNASMGDDTFYLNNLNAKKGDSAKLSLRYQIKMPLDNNKDYDFYSLDVIGGTWDSYIKNTKVTVNLPFVAERYSCGLTGVDGSNLQNTMTGNTLTITSVEQLLPYEGISFTATFPQGSFVKKMSTSDIALLVIAILAILLTALLFIRFGRDKKLVIPVEFYPPDGFSPAQVGYIINSTANPQDATSLIFYWASHGHLHIEEKNKSFVLHKKSELDDTHTLYEKNAFDALWALGSKNSVRESQLEENYYKNIKNVQLGVAAEFEDNKSLTDNKTKAMSRLALAVGMLPIVAMIFLANYAVTSASMSLLVALVSGLFIFAILFAVRSGVFKVINNWYKDSRVKNIARSIAIAVILIIISVALIFFASNYYIHPIAFLAVVVSMIVVTLWSPFIYRRSEYGQTMLERILGFKNFLRDAEKEKLEMLIKETPSYFYDILPFALALGVTKTLGKKFEGLVTEPPTWYYGSSLNTFSTVILISSLNNTMHSVNSSLNSYPSAQGGDGGFGGGGGFSGGGFSGGGSGGGGGGSW